MAGPEDGVFQQAEKKALAPNKRITSSPQYWSDFYVSQLRPKLAPGTFESRKASCGRGGGGHALQCPRRRRGEGGVPARLPLLLGLACLPLLLCTLLVRLHILRSRPLQSYLSMSESETAATSVFAPYRQHEVSGSGAPLRASRRLTLTAGHRHALAKPAALTQIGNEHSIGCAAQVAIPLERAASCLEEVGAEVYGPDRLWEGAEAGRWAPCPPEASHRLAWAGGRKGEGVREVRVRR